MEGGGGVRVSIITVYFFAIDPKGNFRVMTTYYYIFSYMSCEV